MSLLENKIKIHNY